MLRDPVERLRKFNLGPDEFPRFLWEGETMDENDTTIGFLRHPILFAVRTPTCSLPALTPPFKQALRHFVISPSNGIDPTSNMSTKGGYAKQCGVKRVTIESIAYAATMVLSCYLPLSLSVANVTPRFGMD